MQVDSSTRSEDVTDYPEAAIAEQEATHTRLAGATGILALGNILSRILGLIREKTLAYFFGASPELNAFRLAVIVPQTFYDLLIGGHVNGAVVPVLTEIITIQGRDELWKVVNILATFLVMLVALIVIILEVFAPQIVYLIDPDAGALTIDLLRVTSPALLFLGLFAIFSGTLYALKSFVWTSFAGVVFNASIVLTIFLLVPPSGWLSDGRGLFPFHIGLPPYAVMAAAWGWFVGAAVQMAIQLPGLALSKLRVSFNWRHPALRSVLMLYLPVMASLLMDALVIRGVSYRLAFETVFVGSLTYMNQATTLIQFPQGLVATAISVAILPTLAAQATSTADHGLRAFRDTLGLGVRLATTLIIPAAIGLFVLAVPIVRLLFEGGAFDPVDTQITVFALRLYLIGLPFAAIDLLLVYAFYARKDTLTPALIGLFSHLVYIVVVFGLFGQFGLFSLMIADSVKHIVHASVSGVLLRRHIQGYGDQHFLQTALKTSVAALLMGLVGWGLLTTLTPLLGVNGIINQVALVLIPSLVSGLLFLVIAYIFHIDELRWLFRLLRERLLKSSS